MCLGEVVQVREVRPGRRALTHGARQAEISLLLLDEPVVAGDWLLVHSGIALSRLDAHDAEAALALRAAVTTGPPTTQIATTPVPTNWTGGPT